MDKSQSFQQFLLSQSPDVSVESFIFNLVMAAILAYVLHFVYSKYGTSLSNRKAFGRNFVLISMTTMLIITIVKSSLALSLGLVGALSIVRFRAAIKEPEELSFLFLTIAIGLGFGADQRLITTTAFALIVLVLWLKHRFQRTDEQYNIFLSVFSGTPGESELSRIVDVLRRHCPSARLKRFDEKNDSLEATFQVRFDDFEQLNSSRDELMKLGDNIRVHYFDKAGLV